MLEEKCCNEICGELFKEVGSRPGPTFLHHGNDYQQMTKVQDSKESIYLGVHGYRVNVAFVCFDALCQNQQFFSHVRTISFLGCTST